jgi:HSP20 family protein
MPPNDRDDWMWREACEMLEQAEQLHRQFFTPAARRSHQPTWEPPVDVLESRDELWIIVALPGVARDRIEVAIEGRMLRVIGQRPMPRLPSANQIRRLEIPHGRFERSLDLPPGRYEIARRDVTDGCLVLGLRKIGSAG